MGKFIVIPGADYSANCIGSSPIGGDEQPTDTYYSVSYHLIGYTCSQSVSQVKEGNPFVAYFTLSSGYADGIIIVKMGGGSVTMSGNTVSIPSVTGDITISAIATSRPGTPDVVPDEDENLVTEIVEDARIATNGSVGNTGSSPGWMRTNVITLNAGESATISGISAKMRGYYWTYTDGVKDAGATAFAVDLTSSSSHTFTADASKQTGFGINMVSSDTPTPTNSLGLTVVTKAQAEQIVIKKV